MIEAEGQPIVTRTVDITKEADERLKRYAAARNLTPEEAIADLLHGGLRGSAEIITRLNEARRVAMREALEAHDAYMRSLG